MTVTAWAGGSFTPAVVEAEVPGCCITLKFVPLAVTAVGGAAVDSFGGVVMMRVPPAPLTDPEGEGVARSDAGELPTGSSCLTSTLEGRDEGIRRMALPLLPPGPTCCCCWVGGALEARGGVLPPPSATEEGALLICWI